LQQAVVYDHIEYAMASLDMYADHTENLISYTFNVCMPPSAIPTQT